MLTCHLAAAAAPTSPQAAISPGLRIGGCWAPLHLQLWAPRAPLRSAPKSPSPQLLPGATP
eukprot:8569720-Alexandrium_andersonii.AAC.1